MRKRVDFSDEYGFVITLGTIVYFDYGTYTRLGMVIEIDDTKGPHNREVKIMEPSGLVRSKNLDYDVKNGAIRLFDRGQACFLHSKAWDEWKEQAKDP